MYMQKTLVVVTNRAYNQYTNTNAMKNYIYIQTVTLLKCAANSFLIYI